MQTWLVARAWSVGTEGVRSGRCLETLACHPLAPGPGSFGRRSHIDRDMRGPCAIECSWATIRHRTQIDGIQPAVCAGSMPSVTARARIPMRPEGGPVQRDHIAPDRPTRPDAPPTTDAGPFSASTARKQAHPPRAQAETSQRTEAPTPLTPLGAARPRRARHRRPHCAPRRLQPATPRPRHGERTATELSGRPAARRPQPTGGLTPRSQSTNRGML